jgi:predicted MFS family arabinose efflux permease
MKTTTPAATTVLSRTTLLLMATACGLCAGANYFNQPLLNSMVQHLQISDAQASSTVTMAQVSYGLGLLFLVPLGDMLERRRLVLTLMLLAACGMLLSGISGLAGSFALLAAGTLMAGVFSVAAQVLVPMAATFAAPGASGVPSAWS